MIRTQLKNIVLIDNSGNKALYIDQFKAVILKREANLRWGIFSQPINGSSVKEGRKDGIVLFNDALNTFYLRLYGVGHMVNDHSYSERGNPLPPHGVLFSINSKGSFICTIP